MTSATTAKPKSRTKTKPKTASAWGPPNSDDGPLWRIKVIDLTHARAGPTCVRQLADWGAQVIKVEIPTNADDDIAGKRHGFDFQNLHRNKRSLSLDLKQPEGIKVLHKLVAEADVIVENFRPRVKHRLGIDYDALAKINPRLVFASLSGFGQTGLYKDRPGVDQIAQGMSGLMSVTGLKGQGPVRVGIPIADLCSGIFLAYGVMGAIDEREHSGKGQWVHTSLIQAMLQMLDFQAAKWLIGKKVPGQAGNDHPTSVPTGLYKTKDGMMNLAGANNKMFARMCGVFGKPEWTTDPRYMHEGVRGENRDQLSKELNEVTATRTTKEWVDLLTEAGVPAGPVYTIDQTFADPQIKDYGQVKPVSHGKLGKLDIMGQAVQLTRTPWSIRRPSPDSGQHTREIIESLGYAADEIDEMKKSRVI